MELVVLLASLALLALVVISETALRNFRWARLEKLVGSNGRLESIGERLKDERSLLDSLLILRIIAVTVFLAVLLSAPEVSFWGQAWTVLLGLLILLVGVYGVARGVARGVPERLIVTLLPVMSAMERIVRPIRWFQDLIAHAFARALGVPQRQLEEEEARDEMLDAVSEGEREGAIDDDEREMIESIIEFSDLAVSEVMTPRTSVFGLDVNTPIDQAVPMIVETGHSRVPVFEGSLDDVVGILYAKDLLGLWGARQETLPTLRDLMRKPYFVPETKKTAILLRELRNDKVHLAVALDEYGGMSGLITLEDIVEEIVGEIEDEYDRPEEAESQPIQLINEREADVSARVHIDDLNDALNLELPDEEEYDTVGGFLFKHLGRIPSTGETYDFNHVRFQVLDADARRINRVKVQVGEE